MESHNVERAILGAALLNNEVWPQLAEVRPDYFGLTANRLLFSCMSDMEGKFDTVTLQRELERRGQFEQVGGFGYISDLIEGIPERPDITGYVKDICDALHKRLIASTAEAIAQLATDQATTMTALQSRVVDFGDTVSRYTSSSKSIRSINDLPNITSAKIDPPEWLVDGLIPRGSLTLWAGTDGCAKSWLALALANAVSYGGGEFLGRQCAHTITLYLDYENPGFEIKARLEKIVKGDNLLLKHWGHWVGEEPPQIGDPRLLEMCKQNQPLLIVDPLRLAHDAEENDSGEMMAVMRHLIGYANAGATVVVMHHIAKSEGSLGRGSTTIKGHSQLAILQEMTADGLIQLRLTKNRFGGLTTITVAPDFERGTFEVTDAPAAAERRDSVADIQGLIEECNGLSGSEIVRRLELRKSTGQALLKQYDGKLWRSEPGPRNSINYFPVAGSRRAVPGPTLIGVGTEGTTRTEKSTSGSSGSERFPELGTTESTI